MGRKVLHNEQVIVWDCFTVVARGARGSLVGLPALKVLADLAAALRLSGAELGLTPGAREKITTDEQQALPLTKEHDDWGEFVR